MPASSAVDLGAPQGAPDTQVLAGVLTVAARVSAVMSAYCYSLGHFSSEVSLPLCNSCRRGSQPFLRRFPNTGRLQARNLKYVDDCVLYCCC